MFKVLSLSGGGFLGLYTALILRELEERLGAPIGSKFDLIAGTSIGGIIGLAIAKGIPAARIADAIELNGPRLFRKTWIDRSKLAHDAYHMFFSKHDRAALERLLHDIFKPDDTLSSINRNILIPAVNLTESQAIEFRWDVNGKLPDFSIIDVALATSAAPIYFPLHSIRGQLYADGGLYANVPDMIALIDARALYGKPLEEVSMLSIGTTYAKKTIGTPKRLSFGYWNWLFKDRALIDAFIAAQEQTAIFMTQRLLGDRYVRLNWFLDPTRSENVSLNKADPQAIEILKGAADNTIRRTFTDPSRLGKLRAVTGG